MSNLKKILPIILVALMALSWYVVLDEGVSNSRNYKANVEAAKAALADDIPATAQEKIEAAMEIKSSPDLVYLMADYYVKKGQHESCIEWCESYLGSFKKEVKLYEYISEEYYKVGNYEDCIATLETAVSGKMMSDKLKACYKNVRMCHNTVADGFQYISTPKGSFIKYQLNDQYGLLNLDGGTILSAQYKSVGGFNDVPNYGILCPVVDVNGVAWFVDESGDERINLTSKLNQNVKYSSVSCPNESVMAICDESGKYSLINLADFSVVISDAEYIGACSSDRVAVKKNNSWSFKNSKGQNATENPKTYEDVIIDDYGFAFNNGAAFVKSNGGYIMINTNEEKISGEVFESVKPFVDTTYASVCSKGKWGYVDNTGSVKFMKYQGTNSFSNGYGGFCKDSKWGYINASGVEIIKNEFDDSNGFASDTTAIVKYGDEWSMIKYYRSAKLEAALI